MSRTADDSLASLDTADAQYAYHALSSLGSDLSHLPRSLKILLENLLRRQNERDVDAAQIQALQHWQPGQTRDAQIAFAPSRVVLQDFTGVPALVDLAAMRDAMQALDADPARINPRIPVDLVIDHSVMVDRFASSNALDLNTKLEFRRNRERYEFLRWGQEAFGNFRVVPPGTGIVHQVNLEYLADVVMQRDTEDASDSLPLLYPDTLVGTDSHTTMINGLGVLGWGVGGIEAEAAMLGQAITMLLPRVVGFHLHGSLPAGTTATDLVLTVTEQLRAHGVVGDFVEFFGDGLEHLSLADRATIANMAPEYGATCGLFPIDAETIRYLTLTGRSTSLRSRVEAYARAQGLWREAGQAAPSFDDVLELDLSRVVPSMAGPKRPQDRTPLHEAKSVIDHFLQNEGKLEAAAQSEQAVGEFASEGGMTAVGNQPPDATEGVSVEYDGERFTLSHGDVVIAAITSCTNTSNPAVLIAAGLLARNARKRGLTSRPWVKTSLAPGSQTVPRYLDEAGLLEPLRELGFHVVGFGCTTCIGNSGPLPDAIGDAIHQGDLVVCSVLSGNRNFEGRIHSDVRANFLASPPLVVAYALAGTLRIDLQHDPIGHDSDGQAVYLADLWPDAAEINAEIAAHVSPDLYSSSYADVFAGTSDWQAIEPPASKTYTWPESTYIHKPPFFDGMSATPPALPDIQGARCLVKLGDSITTDHISPAGAILPDSPAGRYLAEQGVSPGDFNSLGSRRGNHEVMMRGTFANVRLRNQLVPGREGSATRYLPDGDVMDIHAAGLRYQRDGVPLIVLAGKEYGTGSSRDWAAKGTRLLGVQAVIAESYERIHRSNLIGFGVVPLEFRDGDSSESLGLTGEELFSIGSLADAPDTVPVTATAADGRTVNFEATVRIDTPTEWDYYRHGGILHYVLRQLADEDRRASRQSASDPLSETSTIESRNTDQSL